MEVFVKFFVFDLPPGFADAQLSLPEGSTVGDALDECLKLIERQGVSMDPNELKTATVMSGGRWLNINDAVCDGETLAVIRPMDGG